MIVNPCDPKCPDRHKRCHEMCAAYKLWKLDQKAIAEKRKGDAETGGYIVKAVERMSGKKHEF